jgi:hypothetical protein
MYFKERRSGRVSQERKRQHTKRPNKYPSTSIPRQEKEENKNHPTSPAQPSLEIKTNAPMHQSIPLKPLYINE